MERDQLYLVVLISGMDLYYKAGRLQRALNKGVLYFRGLDLERFN